MKQIKMLRGLAGGLFWLLTLGALTAQTQIGELYYSLDNAYKTARVTMGEDNDGIPILYSGDIVIPESVDYEGTIYAVTSIGEYAFYGCTGLTSIKIPNSVTKIWYGAFLDCTGLTSIEIPSSVTEIVWEAFSGCTGLTSIEIPSSVTEIGQEAFSGCMGLTEVTIADRETELNFDSDVFKDCPIQTLYVGGDMSFSHFNSLTTLETLTIGGSVTRIGDEAFSGCTGLTYVTIADREKPLKFDSKVFTSCPIRTLYLGGNLDSDDFYDPPFAGLSTLETLTIGNSVTRIGGSATFSGCTSLTAIEIPSSVTEIGVMAFSGCTGLTSIEIPASVTTIGESAFSGCTGLTSIEIPSSVTKIGSDAFYSCTGLTSVTIPNSVTEIGERAFSGCTGLMSIELPSSVTTIERYAFSGCTGLTSINIPASVTRLGDEVFRGCTGLTEVTIADRETELSFSSDVFKDCPIRTLYLGGDINYSPFGGMTTLDTLTIGRSVTEIGTYAFLGCTGLTSIYVDEGNASYCSEYGVLYNKDKTHLLLCPAAAGKTEMNIPASVTKIGFGAFYFCRSLTSIKVPTSVTTIEEWAFVGCSGLTSIEIPNSVTEIGNYAFQNCGGLLTLTFGKSVSQIGCGIVDGCDKLRRLICTSEEPAACHTNAFQDIHKIRCDLIVPETALEAYKNALVWGDFLRISGGDGSDKVYVERLSLTSPVTPAELKVGEGMLLSAVIAPANATNKTLTWSSSDKNVLRVDNDGYVMAVAAGEAVVTARTTDGSNLSATCTVTVTAAGSGGSGDDGGDDGPGSDDDNDKILVETLEISTGGASTELQAGGTLQLSAVITPSNATNQAVAWSSSNKKVALVDNDGYVVALAAGEAIITARTADGSDLSATCTLTVTATGTGDEGDDDDILVAALELKPGNTLQLRAVLRSDNATNQTANWSSSDKSVAIIDNDGYVVALAAGEAIITARTTDGSDLSATCHIMVVGDTTAVVGLETLKTVRVYTKAGRIEVRGLPLGTAVTLSGVDGRLWYQTEAVTGPELTLSAPRGHVYVLRLNHTHSLKVYLP